MPGTIIFKPIEANLNHDKDIIGKSDPYCMFIVNGEKIKSQVCKSGGTHPVWNDAVTIPASNQPICFLEIKDKDILKDDQLGSCEIDLREIESQGRLKKWYPIYHKDRPAGEILMEAVFSPQGGIQQGFGGLQQQGIKTQGIPVQTQGVPLQTQGVPLQTQGVPLQTTTVHHTAIPITTQSVTTQNIPGHTMHTHSVLTTEPITQQTQQIHTKEQVIIANPIGQQQQFQPGMQYSGMMPGQGMDYSSYGYGYMGESMSEHYAKEALIRGVDPLGTHLHQYPDQMMGGSQLVGGIHPVPQSNLVSGVQPQLPGQQLPGQTNQKNIA